MIEAIVALGAVTITLLVFAITIYKARQKQKAFERRLRRDILVSYIEHAEELLRKTDDHDARMNLLVEIAKYEAALDDLDIEEDNA